MWLTTAKFFTYCQIVLSIIVGFMKPDFLTLTAALCALFYFHNPHKIRRSGFKWLNLLLAVSVVYDVVWIYFITDFAENQGPVDKREATIKLLSLRLCYVSLLWRVSHL
jgi:4-amino-4-deoxy-L-arabinose transferase-like glycosyltransferase